MATPAKSKSEPEVGPWHALRDIAIACVNKDQFYQFAIAALIVILFWLIPQEVRGQLALRLLADIEQSRLTGYILAVIGFGGWSISMVLLQRHYKKIIGRVAGERNRLQERELKEFMESSNDAEAPFVQPKS